MSVRCVVVCVYICVYQCLCVHVSVCIYLNLSLVRARDWKFWNLQVKGWKKVIKTKHIVCSDPGRFPKAKKVKRMKARGRDKDK